MLKTSLVLMMLTLGCWCFSSLSQAVDNSVEKRIEEPVSQAISLRKNLQKHEKQWLQEKHEKLTRYAQLEQELRTLQEHKEQLESQADAVQKRVRAKQIELDELARISDQLAPFIAETMQRLQQFVAADLPFLTQERKQRIVRVEQIVSDPDVPVSEKLRKTLEALMVEADYGRTIEVTRESILLGETATLVNVFRLGRLGLYFETLDEQRCGVFNMAVNSWQELPVHDGKGIHAALEIGAKRRPAELVALPLGRLVQQ